MTNPLTTLDRLGEITAMFRCGGSLRKDRDGAVRLETIVPLQRVASRLQEQLYDYGGIHSDLAEVTSDNSRKPAKWRVTISDDVETAARSLNLVTASNKAVIGMPPVVISAGSKCAEGAWRGALLTCGHLAEPKRSVMMELAVPRFEVGMAFVSLARSLNVQAKWRETKTGHQRTTIREVSSIGAMLSRLGAHATRAQWESEVAALASTDTAKRLANFDDANHRRSVDAAEIQALRSELALRILGDSVPDNLAQAGQLRIQHREDSLEQLGRLADPPLTKDAIAGRIRRLLALAEDAAREFGIDGPSSIGRSS